MRNYIKLILIAFVLSVTSCSLKTKFFDGVTNSFGVPKQNNTLVQTDDKSEINSVSKSLNPLKSAKVNELKTYNNTNKLFYFVPIVVLVLVGFLVFRLKRQSL